jgi:hypothetical protein
MWEGATLPYSPAGLWMPHRNSQLPLGADFCIGGDFPTAGRDGCARERPFIRFTYVGLLSVGTLYLIQSVRKDL